MKKIKWFERKFAFQGLEGTLPGIIERLKYTPDRALIKLQQVPKEVLTQKNKNAWSMLEHIGHLDDLEPIWIERVKNIINGDKHLAPADLQNTTTHQAGHNKQELSKIVDRFREKRNEFISLCLNSGEIAEQKSALHPRLNTPMRIIDICYFVAEHDDHHLACIEELLSNNN